VSDDLLGGEDPSFDDPTLALDDDEQAFVEEDPVGAALEAEAGIEDPTDYDPRFQVAEDVPDGAHLHDVTDTLGDLFD
jgi:hypothetical protein